MPLITVDGVEYNTEDLSDDGKAQLQSIQFLERQLLVLQNEVAVFKTARTAYMTALRTELNASPKIQPGTKRNKKKK